MSATLWIGKVMKQDTILIVSAGFLDRVFDRLNKAKEHWDEDNSRLLKEGYLYSTYGSLMELDAITFEHVVQILLAYHKQIFADFVYHSNFVSWLKLSTLLKSALLADDRVNTSGRKKISIHNSDKILSITEEWCFSFLIELIIIQRTNPLTKSELISLTQLIDQDIQQYEIEDDLLDFIRGNLQFAEPKFMQNPYLEKVYNKLITDIQQ